MLWTQSRHNPPLGRGAILRPTHDETLRAVLRACDRIDCFEGMIVLVIAPHPDDECIGCGGAICRHVQRGDKVHAVFLTSGELGLKELPREQAWQMREEEARNAAKILQL